MCVGTRATCVSCNSLLCPEAKGVHLATPNASTRPCNRFEIGTQAYVSFLWKFFVCSTGMILLVFVCFFLQTRLSGLPNTIRTLSSATANWRSALSPRSRTTLCAPALRQERRENKCNAVRCDSMMSPTREREKMRGFGHEKIVQQ